jgi:ribonuclease D
VPAMKGWRRELFGDEALKLKRGITALAVQDGRIVLIEREK